MKKLFILILFLFPLTVKAEWENVDALTNIEVRSFTKLANYFFAGTSDGLYYIVDREYIWRPRGTNFTNSTITALASKNDRLFAGTADDGLHFSDDYGSTWVKIDSGLTAKDINFIIVNKDIVIAGSSSKGIYISSDDGQSWNLLKNTRLISLDSKDSLIFYVNESGLYASNDFGKTWTLKDNGLTGKIISSICIYKDLIFTGTNNGLFYSFDKADNWEHCFLKDIPVTFISKADTMIFIGTKNNGLFYSIDKGESWSYGGLKDTVTYTVSFLKLPQAGTQKGLFTPYSNPIRWDNRVLNRQTYGLNSITSAGKVLIASSPYGIYSSSNYGLSWKTRLSYDLKRCFLDIDSDDGVLFAGSFSNEIYTSKDSANTWKMTKTDLPLTGVWTILRNNEEITAGTDNGIYQSLNGGKSWIGKNNGLNVSRVTSLIRTNSGIFAGTYKYGIYFSSDNGNSWIEKNNGLNAVNVYCLAFNQEIILAGTENGVFISNDNGTNWISIGLNNYQIFSIILLNNCIVAGTGFNGVCVTNNWGILWKNTNFPVYYINKLALCGDYLFAVTFQGWLFRIPIDSLTAVDECEFDLPSVLIYPNPASDYIILPFNDEIDEYEIISHTGRKIFKTHDYKIDISMLVPGVYFVKCSGHYYKFIKG